MAWKPVWRQRFEKPDRGVRTCFNHVERMSSSRKFRRLSGLKCQAPSESRWASRKLCSTAQSRICICNSPLSFTTLPLRCVVTIDAHSTNTSKRAILHLNISFNYGGTFLVLSSQLFFFVPIQVSRGSKFHLTFSLAVGLLQTSIFSIKVASQKLTLFTERNQQYRRSRFTCTKNNSQREARLTQAVLKRCKVDHKLSKQLR